MEKFKKITEDNFNDFIEETIYNNWLCKRVETFLIGDISSNQVQLEESLINCESQIEQLLALELANIKLEEINIYNPYIDVIAIEKQKEINIKSKKYRVDFFIPVIYKRQEQKIFIIECDGYEFHQKTKEQVEKDNERQRNLQEEGYEVIRFSGTEIYHKPYQCAMTIKNIILSRCKYIKDE